MGYLTWTKAWSASDNGTVLTGAHLGTIQSDIAAVLNGGLSDANVALAAAILESKIAFNISTGHHHDGVDSRVIATSTFVAQHYRSGCIIKRTGAGTLTVGPGHVEINGTVYNITSGSTTLTLATAGDWVFGSETSNAPAYVYAYNNSGTLAFKLSTEAPDLSDPSDNTGEEPWRYQKYSTTYYRCLGAVWNNASGDIETGTETNFDASSVYCFRLACNGAGVTLPTIWTPDVAIITGASADASPADTEGAGTTLYASRQMSTDFSVGAEIGYSTGVSAFRAQASTWAASRAGGVTFTAQAAGTAGALVLTSGTAGLYLYGVAYTKKAF